jgi:uncharacterized protein (DUF58 family)
MLTALTKLVRRSADKRLFRLRGAEPGEAYLNLRRVFIVPTGAGLGFGVLLVIMLIGALNYNLGLGFALTFAMAACAVVDIYLTFKNLAYLHLSAARSQPVFAGESAQFALTLINRTALERFAIRIDFTSVPEARHAIDVPANGSAAVLLSSATDERGWLAAPRVRLATRFPLGLFCAWSYWTPPLKVLVYPFPEPVAPPPPLTGSARDGDGGPAGTDDFAGIRSYQAGDPMRHLAWRQIARFDPALGGQLVTKHFEGGAPERLCLDLARLAPSMNLELRLSRMTRWVLDAEQRAQPYAFRLGALELAPALGPAHRGACLAALALYGLEAQP